MNKIIIAIAFVVTSAASHAGQTQDAAALARASGCMACHAVDRRMVGPSFREITQRYANQQDAIHILSMSIQNGVRGKWGSIPMPANTRLSSQQITELAKWSISHN